MDDLIPWLAFGIPILLTVVVIAFVVRLITKPAREMKALEERARAGDPEARARVLRARQIGSAVSRAMGADDPDRKRILAEGLPARGTIVDVRATGMEISAGPGHSRVVEVVLSIEDGRGPRQITVRDAVSELHLGRLLKGATVPLRVDPQDPQKIVVLWDTL
jgi:hypothetical protein